MKVNKNDSHPEHLAHWLAMLMSVIAQAAQWLGSPWQTQQGGNRQLMSTSDLCLLISELD